MSTKSLTPTPLQREYWHHSFNPEKKTLLLCVLSLLLSVHISTQSLFVIIGENARFYFNFPVSFLAGMIGGPVFAIGYGLAKDLVGYMLFPTGMFFWGYTLSSIVTVVMHSLFFYHQKITLTKIIACQSINIFLVNIFMNSLWSSILFSDGANLGVYLSINSIKIITIPIEVITLYSLYKALEPTLKRMNLIKDYSISTEEIDNPAQDELPDFNTEE